MTHLRHVFGVSVQCPCLSPQLPQQGCLKVSSAHFFRQRHASKGKHAPNVESDFLQTGVDGADAVDSQHVWHPADCVYIPIVRSIDRSGTPFRFV
jgi:hypothetical protein